MKRILFRTGKTIKKFQHFDKVVRGSTRLAEAIGKNKKLKAAVSKLFSGRGLLTVAGVGGATAVASLISKYIDTNTGCFKVVKGKIECKVKALSCCLPDPNPEVGFCPEKYANPCGNYDYKNEGGSCCLRCSCRDQHCAPDEELECRNATVGEALSYYSSVAVRPLLNLIKYFAMVVITVMVGIWAVTYLGRRMWRYGES